VDALPTTLTLAQLRTAGCAGWKDNYLYVEGTVFRIVAVPLSETAYDICIEPSVLSQSHPMLVDGWSRMPHEAVA